MFAALKLPFMKRRREEPDVEQPLSHDPIGMERLDDSMCLADQFPQVRHLVINLTIRSPDNEIEPSLNNRSFGPQSRAFFEFRCKNVDCVHGGFDLRDEVEEAVRTGRTEFAGRRVCRGWRSRKLVNQQRCFYELNFKAHISYHES